MEEPTIGTKVRMGLVISAIVIGLFMVIGRVYYLQTVQGSHLASESETQVNRVVKLKARRGSILDRSGIELAVSVQAPSIAVRPRNVVDVEETTRKLAAILPLSPETISKRLSRSSAFVWLARQVSPATAERIRDAELPGIEIHVENKRFYPQRSLAGQLVGFTNIDGKGLEGLERKFDHVLRGHEYEIESIRDARGRTLMTREAPEFERLEGHSIQLTIDERIQRVAEDALREQVQKHKALGGFAVAMDVNTGEILALANTPSFDPNQFSSARPADWRLRNVTDAMEPGSVIKPMVLAAAMNDKKVGLDTTFYCEKGRMQIGRRSIKDSHSNEFLTAAEVIRESSNICAYKMAQTLGRERYYEYLFAFGFGQRQLRDVGGEQAGLLWKPKHWAEITFANLAFGQGLSSTPIQVANATAAIANGGKLMRPHVVKRTVSRDGTVIKETKPQLMRTVVSPDVAQKVSWAMSLVTTTEGTAPNAALERYTVAGKTGTAQKPLKGGKGYDPDGWIASFVGFAPAEKPDVVVAVMIDEPEGNHYGGVVAAPAFKRIMEEALTVRDILPVPPDQRFKLPHETIYEKEKRKSKQLTETADPEPAPAQPEPIFRFVGRSLRESLQIAHREGLDVSYEGWGIVVAEQAIGPERYTLVLKPPSQRPSIP